MTVRIFNRLRAKTNDMGHTQGKLSVIDGFTIVSENMYGVADCTPHYDSDGGGPIQLANARRIVAAWNVCEGIETESLEFTALEIARLRAENERLRGLIKQAAEAAASDYSHSIGFQDGSYPNGEPIQIDWLEWAKQAFAAISETTNQGVSALKTPEINNPHP